MLARALPVVVLVVAGFYLQQALKLPIGTTARPGPGFFPAVVAAFACLVALAATVQAFQAPVAARAEAATGPEASAQRRRVAVTVVTLAGFCLAIPRIGYPLAACAFVIAVLRGLGSRWAAAITIGLLSAVGSHYLFAVVLDVPLPRGPW